jgi:hypothetical protein
MVPLFNNTTDTHTLLQHGCAQKPLFPAFFLTPFLHLCFLSAILYLVITTLSFQKSYECMHA